MAVYVALTVRATELLCLQFENPSIWVILCHSMSFLLAHAILRQGIKTLVILQCSKGVPDLEEDDRAFVLFPWLNFPHVLWQFAAA